MRFKFKFIPVVFLLAVAIVFGSFTYPPGGNLGETEKNEILIRLIMQGLSRSHFTGIDINDDFSERVYDLYLKRLDSYKRYLVNEDVEKLEKFRTKLDDEIKVASYDFFDLTYEILQKRLDDVEIFYQDILNRPFDFSVEEFVETDEDKLEYAKNKVELKERWRLSLKFQVLEKLVELQEAQEKAKETNDSTFEFKPFPLLEEEARLKVLKSHDNWYKRLDKTERTDRLNTYLNAIANTFDPHTGYFPPKDKEDFDIQMSGRLEGIGATLSENDGYIKVEQIVLGSASWKQGELAADDLILKVGQGEEDPVDIVDMRLDKAVKLIRGPKGTEVRLTVKKPDGNIIVIPIIRDIVILDETYARSALININKKKKSVGLIRLPKFYADFNQTGGRNCSDDVRDEITKLKNEGVEGIILDLRNNGGGSLNHVVQMAGLFIEEGPIVQVKSRSGSPHVMKDNDPGVFYDGPLVVLVNNFSASASEILAAALQDYNRAVIMGSSSTFGKGTVQRFFDLDRFLSSEGDRFKPLGSVKLTTQKFYRINGGATQLKGVIPDVILPDNYSYIENGEKERDYSMVWDEISPVPFEKCTSYDAKMDAVKESSRARVDESAVFKKINENAERYKRVREETRYSLYLENFRKRRTANKEEADKYKEIQPEFEDMEVDNLTVDLPGVEADSSKMARIEDWHKNLKKDPYVYEAVNVIRDLK